MWLHSLHQILDRQSLSLLISACFHSVHVEILHCAQLHSDNFNTYTPTHTNMFWHTYWLLCNKWAYACWYAHTELSRTFPSNVYASGTIKTWDRLKCSASATVSWVGNDRWEKIFHCLQVLVEITGILCTVCLLCKNVQVRWALTLQCCPGTLWPSHTGWEKQRNGTAHPHAHTDSSGSICTARKETVSDICFWYYLWLQSMESKLTSQL